LRLRPLHEYESIFHHNKRRPDPMSRLDGQCLCGGITYRCDAAPLFVGICHCSHCQKQTGAPFSCSVATLRASFRIEGRMLQTFRDVGGSGAYVERQFCGGCGAQILSWSSASPDLIFLKAGCLNDHSWVNPDFEIWCENAQPWLKSHTSRKQFIRNPPEH
jgi:hypothetical protein